MSPYQHQVQPTNHLSQTAAFFSNFNVNCQMVDMMSNTSAATINPHIITPDPIPCASKFTAVAISQQAVDPLL
jgi:hypothetical protein